MLLEKYGEKLRQFRNHNMHNVSQVSTSTCWRSDRKAAAFPISMKKSHQCICRIGKVLSNKRLSKNQYRNEYLNLIIFNIISKYTVTQQIKNSLNETTLISFWNL